MEGTVIMTDDEVRKRLKKADALEAKGDYSRALEILDDIISVFPEDHENSLLIRVREANMFLLLAKKRSQSNDMAVTYYLAAAGCFLGDARVPVLRTQMLNRLGKALGSVFYFKKCIRSGKEGFASALHPVEDKDKEEIERLINESELMIAESKTSPSIEHGMEKVFDSKNSPEPPRGDKVGELRSFWMGLDVKAKRGFMKVSVEKLRGFVEGVYKKEEADILKKVIDIARKQKTWMSWVCRTKCSDVCSSAEECKTHLEDKHAADFKPSLEVYMVMRMGRNWVNKIKDGGWEPVDTVVAVEMIKTQLEDVKAFTSTSTYRKKGWSNEWPLAADEERSGLLKEIKLLLVSLCEHQILSCSIRDCVMRFPVKHLGELEVSEESLKDCHLVETPQSICFLERDELKKIRGFLKKIKCERHDGTDHVCRAVDSLLDRIRIKESIEFDEQFSLLLLDKRLLKSNNAAPFDGDDDGKIKLIKDPDSHYAKAQSQGDDMISWLLDYAVDKRFPKPIREHNLDTWVAVLRAIQFTCRALGSKYAKKKQVLGYEATLTVLEFLCINEDERRKIAQEDQLNSYASLLCDKFEKRVPENTPTAKLFLCAVRDVVLHEGRHLTFDIPNLEDCMNLIRERKGVSNDTVLGSINVLKSVVNEKVLLIDAKILLIDNSRIRLLKNLTRLSAFDNRSYMLHFLKPFLMNEIVNMESKAKSDAADAAQADLLLEEEKVSQANKKEKAKSIKITSTSMVSPVEKVSQAKKKKKTKNTKITSSLSTPVDKTVEYKPSVDLETGGTSQSPKTMEEDSITMEPKDDVASKTGPLEISSTKDIQEEATDVNTDDMQNMTGEDSVPENLESALGGAAATYNSALDMTLKALVSIKVLKENVLKYNKQPVDDNLEEQVLCALQSLFTAVVSEEIKTEGIYRLILRDLLMSLEEVNSMSSGAAEVLVTVLEFWHCWENSERESLVTRLFTLEENESMSCRKCGRKPNYPEQSSYGIVMAADSIRDLKCAFRNMKFVDILKVMRMEFKMLCDIKIGGCGTTNVVHHVITTRPPIFTIVLEWEKSETEKEISETTEALEWEIDISRLYEGLEPNTNYRLVSMVGYGEEDGEHICMSYEKNRWINVRRESLAGEVVGNSWKNVVRFCGERNVRPVILLYEAA
ncbi:Ubiquitin carboxyl-terminal hydrolase-related protein [Raphanus sativus]|uniref:Uncharacterized protein LOC108807402 n=1 Tax=Raphanus sativus TaxID=3726 RepID=A0A6J0JJI9_RAPSA|nr:uncharacterized protein LOC108807402 [Raphanus sativus]KAJ4887769.1 Ubiquitin carboxyl-terminal hydrolase-related protein [Raphanus sativus]